MKWTDDQGGLGKVTTGLIVAWNSILEALVYVRVFYIMIYETIVFNI